MRPIGMAPSEEAQADKQEAKISQEVKEGICPYRQVNEWYVDHFEHRRGLSGRGLLVRRG